MKRRPTGQKTVIHWANMGKAVVFLLAVGRCVSCVPLKGTLEFVFNLIAGMLATLFCLKYFNLWHDES